MYIYTKVHIGSHHCNHHVIAKIKAEVQQRTLAIRMFTDTFVQ